jgi:hypothetical protein
LSAPKAPKIMEAGRWLYSDLYMRRNNLKIIPGKEQSG